MPQTRKRKIAEQFSDNTSERHGKKPSVGSKKSTRKKETPDVSDNETSKTTAKKKVRPKKENSSDKNDLSSNVKPSKNKTKNENFTLPKKDLKLKKSKEVQSLMKIKSETDNCVDSPKHMDSSDSGILSETLESKVKTTPNLRAVNHKSSIKKEKEINSDSSSESDWEEVEENCEISLDDYKPDIPKEGVEITIDCPDLTVRKRKKKTFDQNEWMRLHYNRVRKDIQVSMHKTHLLCLLAHGIYVNKILNSDISKGLALSFIPTDLLTSAPVKKVDKLDESGIEKIVSWFCSVFTLETKKAAFINILQSLTASFQNHLSTNASEYNLMFIVVARTLGFKVRFCISLYPVTYKASNLIKKPGSKEQVSKVVSSETNEGSSATGKKTKKTAVKKQSQSKKSKLEDSCSDKKQESKLRSMRSKTKNYKLSSDENDSDGKEYVMEEDMSTDEEKVKKKCRKVSKTKPNRKILSSDSDPGYQKDEPESVSKEDSIICWAEIFCKSKKQWISVECVNKKINKPYDVEKLVPQPVSYIIAIDNHSFVKDVTRRYCSEYMTSTIKLRVDPDWWDETLEPFSPPNSKLNKEEEKKLDEILVNQPLPTTVQGFKNHPLYALKRHLLKFEAIYPPDAPPVGFFRGEPVYARDCVHNLHSRETWLKDARVVRIGEESYKVVKARPKWDKIAGVLRTDLPLEIFGEWQTEPYEPPIAVGGKVPRNAYGNVELFKPCMLPKGTVHLQLSGLNRVAKKLNIDCSPAVVGFDGHKGSVHPVFEGFVVCEEFKDVIIAAWDEEQENIRKREEEKREKRIYGNWRKLIKGLLIRERIKVKYDMK